MISKSSLMAIKAMAELQHLPDNEWLGAPAIAGRINAPAKYLAKVLQPLAASRLLVSRKGNGGGFRLGRKPGVITLLDVIQCVEDTEKWTGCFLGRRQCRDSAPCAVHDKWKKVREVTMAFLGDVTLADIK